MITITELFEIVKFNNYEKLKNIMYNSKIFDVNVIKANQSLISKAIEVRSLECFDLLMASPNLKIIYNCNTNLSGLCIALEYYTNAPNKTNRYYLNKLLEYDIKVDRYAVAKCITDMELFDLFFSKLEKSKDNILHLINETILHNHYDLMIILYDYLNSSNISFYDTPEKKQLFNNYILCHAIKMKSMKTINYLKSINHDIISLTISHGIYIPSIFYVHNICDNKVIFNFYYDIMKNMTPEQLKQISNINVFYRLLVRDFYNILYWKNSIYENIDQILKLHIEWADLSDIIVQIYIEMSSINNHNKNSKYQLLMYIILNTKKVNTNPFIKINLQDQLLKKNINITLKKINSTSMDNTSSEIYRKFRYNVHILNYFGFDPYVGNNNDHIQLLFNNWSNSQIESEKMGCIKNLEEQYDKIIVKPIIKNVKSKKTKSSNQNEINV